MTAMWAYSDLSQENVNKTTLHFVFMTSWKQTESAHITVIGARLLENA